MNRDRKLSEIKRDDILEAAIEEFRTNGFSATSMDRIAQTAQVSKRTVYNHFDSKEALFQAITQQLIDTLTQVSDYPYDPDTPVEDQLRAIAELEMEMLTADGFISTVRMITAESLSSPELTQENFKSFEENSIGVVKWIKKAAADGALTVDDPIMAGKQFLSLIKDFALWPQLYGARPVPTRKEQSRVIEAALEMFLNTYLS